MTVETYSFSSQAQDINCLIRFLARRDIPALTADALEAACGLRKADVLLLLGGSIPYGCEAAARAFRAGIAETLMIVGGIGHTTPYLRAEIRKQYPQIPVAGRPEADIIADYFELAFGMDKGRMVIENQSSNCGENARFALAAAKDAVLAPKTVILMQDSSMQQRMDASFRKEWAEEAVRFLSYAAYLPYVRAGQDGLEYCEPGLWGLWELPQMLRLILGEIPRLRDTPDGYGPCGCGYIAHVDIPKEVLAAFGRLQTIYGDLVRGQWQGVDRELET